MATTLKTALCKCLTLILVLHLGTAFAEQSTEGEFDFLYPRPQIVTAGAGQSVPRRTSRCVVRLEPHGEQHDA